ncbi:MAG TPA: hypothetical protein VF147_02885 [Vicinamibacterales bacterium]
MTRGILAAALAIALIPAVSAQERPNFAGKWKSTGSFNAWTITVEGSRMTVTMTVAGNSDSTIYMLDGTPSPKTIEGPNGPVQNVYTSRWEDSVLVTTIKTAGPNSLIEKRWLEPDGTMKVQTILILPGGQQPPPPPPSVLKKVG